MSILGLAVVILWGMTWFLLCRFVPNSAERGHFGDQFGSINALFSGFAFAAIFCSLYAQQSESKKQEERFNAQIDAEKQNNKKQIELAALTSYANLTLALFLNNQQRADTRYDPTEQAKWRKSADQRYDEMMMARSIFEKVLKDAHVFDVPALAS